MKKKILFMVINMNIGGVEKALLNMLKTMSSEDNEVTILMLEKKGGFLNSIPDWVKIDHLPYYEQIKNEFNKPPKIIILDYLKRGSIFKSIYFFIIFLLCKIKGDRELFLKLLFSKYPNYKEEYDEAIAYAGPMSLIDYYIINKVKAKRKISWIHFDITTIGIDRNLSKKMYKNFDQINVVSKDAKEKFDLIFPEFKNKTKVFYNVILKNEIIKLAEEKGFEDNYKGLRLLTVGRISKEKGQDLAIGALKLLVDRGIEAKLYLIGTGNFEQECKRIAKNLGLEEKVVFFGVKTNPYPFMKECDIYIQPSRYEGYCITLAEALIFDKKIIATKFTGALEQLKGKKDSQICDYNSESIVEGIIKLM